MAALDGNDIEATGRLRHARMCGQPGLRRTRDFPALASIDRDECAAEAIVATHSYFDKNDRVAITHYQIEFADAKTDIAREHLAAGGEQVSAGRILCGRTDDLAISARSRHRHVQRDSVPAVADHR